MSVSRTLLVMAGGTGGHVFPGIAVADRMQALGWRVVWLGTSIGIEASLVSKHGIPIEYVRFGGVRGKGLKTKLMLPIHLLRACIQSLAILRRVKPDVVLGMGSYITFPTGIIVALLGYTLVLHEQNSIAGLANKVLARFAKRVLVAFPSALPYGEWIGTPVREEFAHIPEPITRYAARSGPLHLLVLGGSLGAVALNEIVPRALALLAPNERPQVMHQAGMQHINTLRANYAAASLVSDKVTQSCVQLVPFIDDIVSAYARADLIICRSGATTVAEIAVAGVATFFVPYPFAVDDHQTTNAAFLADRGAAFVVQQRDLSAEKLADWLRSQTRENLAQIAHRSRLLAKSDATNQVARICAALAGVSPEGGQ